MDFNFTASVEKEFDLIAEGKRKWENVIGSFYKTFHPAVEEASTYSKQKVGERILGEDPVSGKPISVRIGRFGPVVQIGTADDEDKPQFASLRSNQRMDTITIEDALELFKLPRKPGIFEDKEITVAVGRFGPYVRHDNKFISIPKTFDPLTIELEDCIQLIEHKREADSKKLIKSFDGESPIQLLNGRFGPYILKDGNNYRIPKTTDPNTLTLEDCLKLIADQGEKPAKKGTAGKSKRSAAGKTVAKKSPAKKKTTTSSKKPAGSAKKKTTSAKTKSSK
jgi:DNA topoisomerase I